MLGPESAISFTASSGPDGDFFDIYAGERLEATEYGPTNLPYLAPATGTFDVRRNEVRIHAALDDLAEVDSLSEGARLTQPVISGRAGVVTKSVARSFTTTAGQDTSPPGAAYTMSERSCVTPGV